MFQTSWSQFVFTAAVIVGMYYTIAVLLLYSREIIAFAKSGFRKVQSPQQQVPVVPATPIMGEVRTNDQELIEERFGELRGPIVVADSDDEPETMEPAGKSKEDSLKQHADELIGEANAVVQLAIDCDSDRDETAVLFNALLIRYTDLSASPFRASVNTVITEAINQRLSFQVTSDEVDRWWNE